MGYADPQSTPAAEAPAPARRLTVAWAGALAVFLAIGAVALTLQSGAAPIQAADKKAKSLHAHAQDVIASKGKADGDNEGIKKLLDYKPHTVAVTVGETHTSFVPHPFNSLQEFWADPKVPFVMKGHFLTDSTKAGADVTQSAAMKNGFFEPLVNGVPKRMKIFSTAQARQCLRGRKVMMAGDSYMKQFSIGLADILLGEPHNDNLGFPEHGPIYRHNYMLGTWKRVRAVSLEQDLGLENVMPSCMSDHFSGCYGMNKNKNSASIDSLAQCSKCLGNPVFQTKGTGWKGGASGADVVVVATTVHLMTARGYSPCSLQCTPGQAEANAAVFAKVTADIKELWKTTPNLIWATGPRTSLDLVPGSAAAEIDGDGLTSIYENTCGGMNTGKKPNCLDFYHMTDACQFKNCTYDGSHFQRFANRAKAQSFLNMVCKHDETSPSPAGQSAVAAASPVAPVAAASPTSVAAAASTAAPATAAGSAASASPIVV